MSYIKLYEINEARVMAHGDDSLIKKYNAGIKKELKAFYNAYHGEIYRNVFFDFDEEKYLVFGFECDSDGKNINDSKPSISFYVDE